MTNKMSRRQFLTAIGGITGAAMIDPLSTVKASPTATRATAPADKELRFNKNGEFKIAQFTDFHYNSDDFPRSELGLKNADAIIAAEKPDLIIVTGDIIRSVPGMKPFRHVADRMDSYGIPFVILFGNHDPSHDRNYTLGQYYDMVREHKNCIQPERGQVESPDYVLRVKSHDGSRDAAAIYCFDSHDRALVKGVDTYDWIHFDQIAWYREQSKKLTAANGGEPLPSVAYFHIPLPEFRTACINNKWDPVYGNRREPWGPSELNSGLFTSMKEMGDILGVFCGHDHDIDIATKYYDVLLAYGRFSGGNCVYNHLPRGSRLVVLKEGQRKLDTYIREMRGDVVQRITFPDTFINDDTKKRPADAQY